MKVLSLFDGMACGMLAMKQSGIEVERYVAFEIDKYAVQTSSHNFPIIEHRGDVFKADFTEFVGFDYLVGGSPCTYWSIAQKNGRETEASGMGWELFSQYVRALKEAKPRFFIYENNKSMSNAIRESITETFGFEPVCINSALVSAQNRIRLYWVGRRNESGTYSKVDVDQPVDRGILLRDILDCAEAVCVAQRGGYAEDGSVEQHYEAREDGKTNVLTTVQKDNNVCEPVRIGCYPSPDGTIKNSQGMRLYSIDGKSVNMTAQGGGLGAKSGLYAISVGNMYEKQGQNGQLFSIDGKSKTLSAGTGVTGRGIGSSNAPKVCVPLNYGDSNRFALAIEWNEAGEPTKAVSGVDAKEYTVYRVKDGQITIKGKQYPIKLEDGFYIIRKLTVKECMRLQTVPEWYEFPVSDSQAYKMLGNGWTVDVIAHLIAATRSDNHAKKPQRFRAWDYEQITLF